MSQLEFREAAYRNGGKTILDGLNVSVEAGDFVSIVGPSGSGKSTFLKLCCHLISPTEGDILWNGTSFQQFSPTELRKRIGYCFQTPVLFGDSVESNMSFPYSIRKQTMDRERVEKLFSCFQMSTEYLQREIRNLSGGEKQRIALIRALLFQPEVLLLDEVTSALDTENTKIVEEAVETLNREGITVLWVTHNPEQSRRVAKHLLTMESGQIKSWEAIR